MERGVSRTEPPMDHAKRRKDLDPQKTWHVPLLFSALVDVLVFFLRERRQVIWGRRSGTVWPLQRMSFWIFDTPRPGARH